MKLLQSLIDSSSHAIFTLDREGIITHINRQAKLSFGLLNRSQFSHPAGRLMPGDLVVLADTAIGADDGHLLPVDLECLGICDKRIHAGDSLAVIGAYRAPEIAPVYKFLPSRQAEHIRLEAALRGVPIAVDLGPRTVTVTVREVAYSIDYFSSIGQMILIDGQTLQVKFWQEKGYSALKEGIGELLRGGQYAAKAPGQEIAVEGSHFRAFFEGALFTQHLEQVMTGQVPRYDDMEYDINGYDLVASITPVPEQGMPEQVIVRFRSIEDMRVTILERNRDIISAERKYRQAERALTQSGEEPSPMFGVGTASPAMWRQAHKLSLLDCDILITGESGTGKSCLAKSIVQAQPRQGPFVTVDCSTISPTLFESEMFGYVGGAFTGASPKGKAGFFEAAHGGTIFLDEIGEVPLAIQSKLLNVIQNKLICRVGSTRSVPVDVRILAATNRNLKEEVRQGRFRQDLYYRLSAFTLELPPLRGCQENIYFIIHHLLEKITRKYGTGKKSLSGEAFGKLISYPWPGNIRELENVLESAVVLSESDIIWAENINLESAPARRTLKERLKAEEERILRQTLAQCGGSRAQAMELLGLSKTAFYSKLKEYHI